MKTEPILIVDDKKTNRIILESHLQRAGYVNIFHASSGWEALEVVQSMKPSLVLLDIVMPGMNGIEVCRRLKKDKDTMLIPVIMVTALEDREAKLKCLEMGADDFLNKPIDFLELMARVKTLLKIKSYFEQLQTANTRLLENINTAQKIQQALFPAVYPKIEGIIFNAYYKPAEILGGDFYNVFLIDEDHICLYVSDVTGHQLDSAMLTIFIKENVQNFYRWDQKQGKLSGPRACLKELEKRFRQERFPAQLFITIFLAVFNCRNQQLTYSASGFSSFPHVYTAGGIQELVCPGPPIMSLDIETSFQEKTVYLQKAEGVLLFTDGLVEQNAAGSKEEFGPLRLRKLLKTLTTEEDKKNPIPLLIKNLYSFAGVDKFRDDIALFNMYICS